ncbi:hypothetical protein GCM10009773_05280 [Williamsia serinedens]
MRPSSAIHRRSQAPIANKTATTSVLIDAVIAGSRRISPARSEGRRESDEVSSGWRGARGSADEIDRDTDAY